LILRASNKTKYVLYLNSIAGIITISVGIFLIPKYLLLGAIITYVVSLILPGLFQLFYEIKMIGYSFFDFFPLKNFLAIILIGGIFIPIFLAVNFLMQNSLSQLILCSFIYFPIVFYVFYKFKFLPFGDMLKRLLKS
jgi:hypothetical protein